MKLPRLSKEQAQDEVSPTRFFCYNRFKKIYAPNKVFESQSSNRNFKKVTLPTKSELADLEKIKPKKL
ncbi:MAG: hypothetical protein AABY64_07030 [Bdellovibrionota bacterium]